jgi:DNA-directed RNA polymerase subunit RPC12/RpoP
MNAQRPRAGDQIPVVCDVCHARVYVGPERIGQEVVCPDCQKRLRVKPPPPAVAPAKPRYTGDEYRLADDSSPTSPQPEFVKLVCATCYTLMHAKVEHVGKRVKCPDCGTINRVPRPPEKKKNVFEAPDASDIVVESAPPPLVDQRRKEIADRLMSDAQEHVERRERERPKLPKDPLRDGIYSFPFYANVAPLWIGTTVALLVDAVLFDALIDVIRTGGLASIMAAFLAPIVAIVTFCILGLVAPHFLTIIEFTADGYDRIPYWPAQDLLSRLRALLFAVNALAMSTLPGMLLVGLLRPLGVPLEFGLVSTVLLLPLLTLSMAENDSVFAPYSRSVFGSLGRLRRSWSRFYSQIILLALAIVVIDFIVWGVMNAVNARAAAASDWRDMISRVLLIASVCLYAVIYCRLVGRMALILGQEEVEDDQAESKPESGGSGADGHTSGTAQPMAIAARSANEE